MKKGISLILSIIMMAASFTACAPKEEPANQPAQSNSNTSSEEKVDISTPVTLKWYLHGSNVKDAKPALDKANEYLKEKLNVTLEPIWGTWGDFDQNSVLAINGGDDVDIYFTCSWSADEYNAFAKKGAWVRLDKEDNNLIEKHAKDLFNQLPKVLVNGSKIEGSDGYGVYAVPGYKDIANQYCWDINVPLLKKYGYSVDDIKKTDYYGFGEILEKVKKGEGKDFYPLLVEGCVLERFVNNVAIVTGDSGTSNMLSYYINPKDLSQPGAYENKIMNKFATPEYKKFIEQSRKYYQAGYIDPAMGNRQQANDKRQQTQLSGKYLIGTQCYSFGYETQVKGERGFEVAFVPTTDPFVDTTSSQGAMMAISTASKNPDRAMMFLNLLNTDPKLFTLLDYGVEGTHYELADGKVKFIKANRDNYMPWTMGMGNVTQLPPLDGQSADFWTTFKDYYGNAKEIPTLGWAFDQTNVKNEMAALANVAQEYDLSLSVGAIDPAAKLPEFLKKLEDNGITKVVDEANSQLEKYLSAKK